MTLRLTGGNPLFACELFDDKAARAALVEGREPPTGHGVRGVLRRHLEQLAPEIRTSLQCAAIAGDPIDVALIAAVTARPTTEVAAHVEAARQSGVLGAHGFAHALFRAAACADIPSETRATMHVAIAERLSARPNTARQVAIHLHKADPTAPATARALCAAAKEAMAVLAHEEAVGFAAHATELDEQHERVAAQADALGLLAEARAHAGDLAGSVTAAQRAIVLAREVGDPRVLARAALALGLRRVMAALDPEATTRILDVLVANDLVTREAGGFGLTAAPGWRHVAAEVIRAQAGLSFEMMSRMLAPLSVMWPELGALLERDGSRYLDVGVGAAGGAIALCKHFPRLRCVGIDPHRAAHLEARAAVTAAGLGMTPILARVP